MCVCLSVYLSFFDSKSSQAYSKSKLSLLNMTALKVNCSVHELKSKMDRGGGGGNLEKINMSKEDCQRYQRSWQKYYFKHNDLKLHHQSLQICKIIVRSIVFRKLLHHSSFEEFYVTTCVELLI